MRRERTKLRRGSRLPILPSVGLFWHLILLALLFLLTQAFPIALTATLWRFALAFSIGELLLFVLSLCFLKAELDSSDDSVERRTPSKVRVTFRNGGPLPISLLEASLTLPADGNTPTYTPRRRFSLPPFSALSLETETAFLRRGHAQIGCREVYAYDFLHLFRVRRRLYTVRSVRVLPRRLPSKASFETDGGHQELATSLLELTAMTDYGDIRDYRPGDSMKQIHWKLSTKSEELQVRRYSSESKRHLLILCDPSVNGAMFSSEEARLEVIDTVLEEALAAMTAAIDRGFEGLFHIGGEDGFCLPFGTDAQRVTIQNALTDYRGDGGLPTVDSLDRDALFFYVLPFTSISEASALLSVLKTLPLGAVTILVCEIGRYLTPERWADYEGECEAFCRVLRELGVTVLHGAIGEVSQ